MGKGEIARNEQFLLFPQCFLLKQIIASYLSIFLPSYLLFAAEFEESRIGKSGEGITCMKYITEHHCFRSADTNLALVHGP